MTALPSQVIGPELDRRPQLVPRRVPVRSGFSGNPAAFENCRRQREALEQMDECERITGKTAERLRDEMQEQRARVLQRYGLKEAA